MFLLIDNYDSFTFNLVQAFQQLGADPVVVRNDKSELLELAGNGKLERVCISPGPSTPHNAGYCLEFLSLLPPVVPVMGVCLGHQCLGAFAGATVNRNHRIMHGKTSKIFHNGEGLFKDIADGMEVCRYHSLTVRAEEAADKLEITATADRDEVMGLRYKDRPWHGVQFHPESILTPKGPQLLDNFLKMSA
ncbi:anthranilate synthase component II [Pseudodesulfovibrio senegalensis]|uniref:Aminodeoxychorismate/anthranilate synthase component II n=1 Tax=Pseudodesulfovibrio senegalensis TaxID=1721087 RepID=A0A6N6MWR2_9BACT|nr:aminodeoxychorismate/anthranilate synthase component II [Pseudodesulfovibrio senegalensis]KAB1438793.1 aminodeoxychorismate/anthranilate synthase component II [Pseudodesulfovibrio senegalensis]